MKTKKKQQQKVFRHRRVRAIVSGSAQRPRICVFRSLRHIGAQLIDDTQGRTLVSVSTKGMKSKASGVKAAQEIGKALAEKAQSLGIKQAVFDRGGYKYHGKVKAVADAAREGGLKF